MSVSFGDGDARPAVASGMLDKLKSRTEWQAYLTTIITLFCNDFLNLGLSELTVGGMVTATVGYGVSRGLAKHEPPVADAPIAASAADAAEADAEA